MEVRRPFTLQVLKIGERDAVRVGALSTLPAGPVDSAEKSGHPNGVTERAPPPLSPQFQSIKAEENHPAERPANHLRARAGRATEIRVILASQMDSRVSLEGSINATLIRIECPGRDRKAPTARQANIWKKLRSKQVGKNREQETPPSLLPEW
jgi:hypothetical protein